MSLRSRCRLLLAAVVLASTWLSLPREAFPQAKGSAETKGKDQAKTKEPVKGTAKGKKKGQSSVNRNNDAYEAIKKVRREIVKKYLDALFGIAKDCTERKLPEAGWAITERILKVVEPPRNRRKVITTSSGVGLDKEGERQAAQARPQIAEVKQKPLSPEEAEELKEVRDRVSSLRTELGVGDKPPEKETAVENPIEPLVPDGDGTPGSDPDSGSEKKAKPRAEPKAGARPKGPGSTVVVGKKDEGKKTGAPGDEPAAKAEVTGKGVDEVEARERRARAELMKKVEKLAVQCVEQGFPAHAYEILLWAIDLDPDNKSLRKNVRQYELKDDQGKLHWYSPFEMAKAKKGFVQHPEYGWVTPKEIQALKAGKLLYKNQWVPREKVETERQKWENRWTHETEHFEIATNADLKDAVLFGREVERLYAFFFRVFIDFYSAGRAADDSKLVFGGGKELSKKLRLHYYRSREHYLAEVQKDPELKSIPNPELVAQSAGFYWGQTGKAYFYRGPSGPDLSVIYHEVTHQLFGETYDKGPRAPTWLVEGLGVFMEDPVIRGERLLAGAEPPPGIKPGNARDLNDFVKNHYTQETFHGGRRGDNYATGGAVIQFFLFYKGGIYRQPFMRYAREAYRNTQDESPTAIKKLYEYLSISEEQLQEDWEVFNAHPDLFDF